MNIISEIGGIYENSLMCRAVSILSSKVALILPLKKANESNLPPLNIDDSFFYRQSTLVSSRFMNGLSKLSKHSQYMDICRNLKAVISENPLQSIGVGILAALLTNIVVYTLLAKETNSMTWAFRITFFIIGTIWAFCNVHFKEVEKTSLFIKMIRGLRK